MELTVAVATFRRPDELIRCLLATAAELRRSLDEGVVGSAEILVVDNDARASAEPAVRRHADPLVRYVHEPEPGISAARNRALDESRDSDLLMFLDDDETPEPGWATRMLLTRHRERADAVAGRVISDFGDGEIDPWVAASRFFERPRRVTGQAMPAAATNNLLLDRRLVERLGLRFEPRYGLTGGGDTHFTRSLVAAGGRLIWCHEAAVVDHVPGERITRGWVLARARRMGNSDVAVSIDLAPSAVTRLWRRGRGVLRGTARIGAGRLLQTIGAVSGSAHPRSRGAVIASRGVGMATAAVGRRVVEYARTDNPATVASPA